MSAIIPVKLKEITTPEGMKERIPDISMIGLPVSESEVSVLLVTPDEAFVKIDLIPLLRRMLARVERLERAPGGPPP